MTTDADEEVMGGREFINGREYLSWRASYVVNIGVRKDEGEQFLFAAIVRLMSACLAMFPLWPC